MSDVIGVGRTVTSTNATLNTTRRSVAHRLRVLNQHIVRVIQKVHLFAGLLMLPWVLLYGATATLFNHPTWMTGADTDVIDITLSPKQLAQLPQAHGIAEMALMSAQESGRLSDRLEGQKIAQDSVRFNEPLVVTLKSEAGEARGSIDLNSGKGVFRYTANHGTENAAGKDGKPNAASLRLPMAAKNQVVDSYRNWASDLHVNFPEDVDVEVRSIPPVEFKLDGSKEDLLMRFSTDEQRRRGSGRRDAAQRDSNVLAGQLEVIGENPGSMDWRDYFTRLHKTHGYPIVGNVKIVWAVIVDMMFMIMVFWGLSGVYMWLQIQRMRKIGVGLLVVSGTSALLIASGMHTLLING